MLLLNNISYAYDQSVVLSDVSLNISQGQMVGVFGANGSGKSTLLKMLSGLLPIKNGEVEFFFHNALKDFYIKSSVRAMLGVLMQSTSSDEKISGKKNLYLAAKLFAVEKNYIDQQVEKILSLINLGDKALVPVKKLSEGMRRRLELYRTFIHDPKLLLLDEPTASLDFLESKRFFDFAKRYKNNGSSLLIATHKEQELLHCDRVIMLHKGHVIADSTPEHLLNKLDFFYCTFMPKCGVKDFSTKNYNAFDLEYCYEKNQIKAKISLKDKENLFRLQSANISEFNGFFVEDPNMLDTYEILCRDNP